MAQMIADTVGHAWANFLQSVALYLPRVLATLSIVIVGWVIAALLRVLTRWLLRWTRFDALSERLGLAAVLKRADLPPASVLAGTVVF